MFIFERIKWGSDRKTLKLDNASVLGKFFYHCSQWESLNKIRALCADRSVFAVRLKFNELLLLFSLQLSLFNCKLVG